MRVSALCTIAVLCVNVPVSAETYQVGPGRTYETLQEVVDLLDPGDVVEVDPGYTYPGGVTFTRTGTAQAPITIRGLKSGDSRAVLSGGTNTVAFTTPWPYEPPGADHYVFEGFEVTGGSSRCIYHQAGDLVIRDVVVHDCPAQGILGADQGSGSLTLERSEVYSCGAGSSQHQIYMSTDQVNRPGSVFRMQFCYLHDGNGGNNVKSRSERNEVYYNWIEGAYYHELELIGPDPWGVADGWTAELKREDSDVVGNVLWKKGSNSDFSVTRVGGDGTGESDGRYRFVNNTIISGSGSVFRIFDGIQSIEMHNNMFYRPGSGGPNLKRTVEADWATGAELIAGSNNWVEEGATNIPTQWTGTILGSDPGVVDLTSDDPRPTASGALVDQATSSPTGPPGYPFPSPLFPPAFHPPLDGTSALEPRVTVGSAIDIGAYEYGVEDILVFYDGFETGDVAAWSGATP